jgi:single-strand DNA-binding protein
LLQIKINIKQQQIMAGINKVILVGNLGKDPEIRALESGVKVAQFSMATTESYKDNSGNWQDQTEWHNIVMWRYLAERAEKQLHKGSQIYLEGKIRTRQWTDKENNTRYTTEIIADKFMMLGKREGQGGNYPPPPTADDAPSGQTTQAKTTTSSVNEPEITSKTEAEDDLPF